MAGKAMTITQAKQLKKGDLVHRIAPDGQCEGWMVSGAPRAGRADPDRITVPVRRMAGFHKWDGRNNAYITQATLDEFHLGCDCAHEE
jgi:hypothetical protein